VQCKRAGCDRETKRVYCSVGCSNKDNPRRRRTRVYSNCTNCGNALTPDSTVVHCIVCRYLPEIVIAALAVKKGRPDKEVLYRSGLKKRECEDCGISEWQGHPAPLQLEHVDGDNSNNRIENLRILCANCHALTPTFGGKNKGRPFRVTRL
jgi:hypothetical protein